MARLPYIDGDKGNWGEILNTWLKHVAGYKGIAPAKPANGNLPAGVAVNGNGYGTNDQYQSDNSGLNFHNDFPANAPDGFTFIHTVHNRIYRKEGNGWAVLLEGGVGSSQTASDSDWYEVGTGNPPNNINDDIYTSGNVAIGKLTLAPGVRLDVDGKTATDTIQIKGPSAGVNKILVSNDTAGNAVWKNTSELLGTLTVQPISNSSSVITVNPSTFNPSDPTAQTIGIGLTGGNENQIIIRTQNGYNWTNPSTLRPLLDLGTLTLSVQPSSASVLSINPNTNPNYNPANNSNQGIQVGLTGGQPNQVIYRTPDQNNPYQWRNPEELIPRGSLVAGNLINFAGDPSNRLIGSGDLTINAVSQTLSTASIQNNGGATINLSGNGGSVSLIHGTATQVVRNNDGTIQINVTDATDRILQRGSLVAGNQVTLSGPLTNRLIGSGDVTINHATINTTSSTTPGTIQAVTSLGINNGHVTSITNSGINAGNGISITQSGGTYTISNTAPNQNDADWFVAGGNSIPTQINQSIWTDGNVGIGTNIPNKRLTVNGGIEAAGGAASGNTGYSFIGEDTSGMHRFDVNTTNVLRLGLNGSNTNILLSQKQVSNNFLQGISIGNTGPIQEILASVPFTHSSIFVAAYNNFYWSGMEVFANMHQVVDGTALAPRHIRTFCAQNQVKRVRNGTTVSWDFHRQAAIEASTSRMEDNSFSGDAANIWLNCFGGDHLGSFTRNGIGHVNARTFSSIHIHFDPARINQGHGTTNNYLFIRATAHNHGEFFVSSTGNLYITGEGYKPGGGSWANTSDIRLKTNINNIDNALSKIMQLRPVRFKWIKPEYHRDTSKPFNNNLEEGGFIAQEVEKIFPDCVSEGDCREEEKELLNGDTKVKMLSLNNNFTAHLVRAIQEQQQMIEEQRAMIEDLQKQINELKKNK